MPDHPITNLQAAVLSFVRNGILKDKRCPTTRAIAKHFGWQSEGSSRAHLRALVKKGYLVKNTYYTVTNKPLPNLKPTKTHGR